MAAGARGKRTVYMNHTDLEDWRKHKSNHENTTGNSLNRHSRGGIAVCITHRDVWLPIKCSPDPGNLKMISEE